MWATPKLLADHSRRRGFTIVELLIVIVVIGILAAITIVAYNGIQQRVKIAVIQSDLEQGAKQLETYRFGTSTSEQYPVDQATANLKASPGTTLNYQANNSTVPPSYCLTAVNGSLNYWVSNTSTSPTAGTCTGVLSSGASCPTGFIVVPGSSTFGTSEFCVMKYEAKNVGGLATSQVSGLPWNALSQSSATSAATAACSGCHLITDAEWLTIAQNVLGVASNWSGGSVGSGYIYSGHNDSSPIVLLAASTDSDGYSGTGNTTGSNQRRTLTLSNGEVIWDLAGNATEWTSGTVAANQQPGQTTDGNYVFRDWNNPAILPHGFSGTNFPSYARSGASGWTSTQGIGQLYSYYNGAVPVGISRGGDLTSTGWAGIYAMTLNKSPSDTNYANSFRVTK
ncbi:MAG: hypothetical protein JWN12_496 [Candidatus Saccharibacteria bacterium]|nr:hypothetical protein [Candidatus Saccharibacteria bacterium]